MAVGVGGPFLADGELPGQEFARRRNVKVGWSALAYGPRQPLSVGAGVWGMVGVWPAWDAPRVALTSI